MNAKDRLIMYLKYKKIGQTRFEEKCGIGRSYISNSKGSIGTDTLFKIASTDEYSDLDFNWLITGKGNMVTSENKNVNDNTVSYKKYSEVLEDNIRLRNTIDELRGNGGDLNAEEPRQENGSADGKIAKIA